MSGDHGRAATSGFTHAPGTVLGYRKDGRPIHPIAGGDRNAPDAPPAAGTGANAGAATGADGNGAPTLTHSGCINRLHDIRSAMAQIAELEHPSTEDDTYFRELSEEFDRVDAHRLRLEREAQLRRVATTTDGLSAARHLRAENGAGFGAGPTNSQGSRDEYDRDAILEPDSIDERRFRNPWDYGNVRQFGREPEAIAAEWRARALSACERMQGTTDKVRQAATEIVERSDDDNASLSQLMLALSAPQYMRAWAKLARAEGGTAELTTDERQAVAHVRHVARSTRAMSLTDTAGGYLVPLQLDPTVILTANGSVNQIRQIARTVIAIGDTWSGVSAGAVSWSYDAEAAEVSDDAPAFASPSIPIYKADGFVPISLEAMQDAANVTQEVGRLLAEGKDVLEAQAFAIGSGVGMPTGIVTALAGSASVVPSTTADTLTKADLFKLQGALPARYRANASWLANNGFYNTVRQFGDDVWGALADGNPNGLLGRPHYESEDMDGVVTAAEDNNMAVFGDFRNFVIADRVGMTVEFVPHLFGANRRPTNQRGWLAYVRHGADSVNDAAFRMLNVT